MKGTLAALAIGLAVAGCASMQAPRVRGEAAREQVAATERAFAKTMADRDLQGFASFLSDEAVFFAGPTALRGKKAVVDRWSRLYKGAQAPFSWEPKTVEVLDSGTLALSSGPVHDPQGKLVGCFSSIWRQEAPGVWKIVFDRGTGPQECDKP